MTSFHAFFHGEKAPPPLEANVVITVGNCGLYTGPWGVRVEDTVVVGADGPTVLTAYPRTLEPARARRPRPTRGHKAVKRPSRSRAR